MGPEFIGTLLAGTVPGQEQLTLNIVTLVNGVQTITSTYLFTNCRRYDLSNSDKIFAEARVGEQWQIFHIYRTVPIEDGFIPPQDGYSLLDSQGVTWQIRNVDTRNKQGVYYALCQENVGES